jgi:hypothetical protein
MRKEKTRVEQITRDEFEKLPIIVRQCIGSSGANYNSMQEEITQYICHCSLECPYQLDKAPARPYCMAKEWQLEIGQ